MYSLFPELFSFSILATTLLRVTLGVYLVVYGLRLYRRVDEGMGARACARLFLYGLSIIEMCAGILLLFGLFTQGAALVAMAISIIASTLRPPFCTQGERSLFLLMCTIALVLLFLGAGPFAFDLPL